ncbi:MAG: NADH-quinone oxidoreductase subunit C [Cyclobacteriaceae bacterium]|jgi:NADH-quinone oxidoreductase subunit C
MRDMEDQLLSILTPIAHHPFHAVPDSAPYTLQLHAQDVTRICQALQQHDQLYFDQLSCITGLDNGPEANTLEVIYHLYSIPFNRSLALRVVLPREAPELESVASLWKSANWLEREVFDMYGIHFTGHPDLRRILMPADWEGFPLRRDYQHQETYHGVTVKY